MTLPATVSQLKAQLTAVTASELQLEATPQIAVPPSIPERKSAVLLLFTDVAAHSLSPVLKAAGPSLLLTKRASHLRYHPGEIAFPGGGLEPQDQSLVGAALREAHEEAGVVPRTVEVLGTLPEVRLPVSNNLVTPVIGWWQNPSALTADPAELDYSFTTPLAELLNPENRGVGLFRRGNHTFKSPAFQLPTADTDLIWGFTGFVLSGLFSALNWEVPWDAHRTFDISR